MPYTLGVGVSPSPSGGWYFATHPRIQNKGYSPDEHRLDEDEKGRTQITTLGGNQKMTIISKSGWTKMNGLDLI